MIRAAMINGIAYRCIRPLLLIFTAVVASCSTLPPGAGVPRVASSAWAHPETSHLAHAFANEGKQHDPDSGFRIIPVGADGLLLRLQLIRQAERTLDLQYFIFREDHSGRLLTGAILRAAERGVRVRILVDDAENDDDDEQFAVLRADPRIQIRYFNPFAYRGHLSAFRTLEFVFNSSRLDYRMHNKLLVADNAVALIGGRNIGDAYFQIDPAGQYADDDVFAAGPIVAGLSATFDEFWNHPLSISIEALSAQQASAATLGAYRVGLCPDSQSLRAPGVDCATWAARGEPLDALVSGRLPLVWAHADLVYDSPDKKNVENGNLAGRLMRHKVVQAAADAQDELLIITPYLVPGVEGMELFRQLHERRVRLRVLTNSLESSTEPLAQAAYMGYRQDLLALGVELYEIRSRLGNSRGSGQTPSISSYGNYSLHAKLFVLDRQRIFIGSMNLDQRSLHLNTEIGLIIDSPTLAQQVARRFEAMVQPANAYEVVVRTSAAGKPAGLGWRTAQGGSMIEYEREPARSCWQRFGADVLRHLPIEGEL